MDVIPSDGLVLNWYFRDVINRDFSVLYYAINIAVNKHSLQRYCRISSLLAEEITVFYYASGLNAKWKSGLQRHVYFDGLMQKRRNSIANALELCLFYMKPWIWSSWFILFDIRHAQCNKKSVFSTSFCLQSISGLSELKISIFPHTSLYSCEAPLNVNINKTHVQHTLIPLIYPSMSCYNSQLTSILLQCVAGTQDPNNCWHMFTM